MKYTALMFRPLDLLYLRGNRLFGGAGDHSDALMPPWPSVFTGAVLSRALADAGRMQEAAERRNGPSLVSEMFGAFSARLVALADKNRRGRIFFPLPADLAVLAAGDTPAPIALSTLPRDSFSGCSSSLHPDIPEYPVLRTRLRAKPARGYWITIEGLTAHMEGKTVEPDHLVRTSDLWNTDSRLGIAMDSATRTVEEGRIYTSDTIALADGIGFLCVFSHERGDVPEGGLVRLGGDGRGAEIFGYPDAPVDLGRPQEGWSRFRMILATPCPSEYGWIPPHVKKEGDGIYLTLNGFRARLMSSAVNRYEVISGWDMVENRPKDAARVIPGGSVYWFEVEQGDTSALEDIWKAGLIPADDEKFTSRRREGFGQVWFCKA